MCLQLVGSWQHGANTVVIRVTFEMVLGWSVLSQSRVCWVSRRAWGAGDDDEASIDICFKEAVFIGQRQN